jgi:sarcosine oxidase subunit alpha
MPNLRLATAERAVTILIGGEPVEARENEPVAVALWAAGYRVLRRTADHQMPRGIQMPRGLFCAAGICQDCLVVIDGQPNVRACVTPVRDGMGVELPDIATADSGGS